MEVFRGIRSTRGDGGSWCMSVTYRVVGFWAFWWLNQLHLDHTPVHHKSEWYMCADTAITMVRMNQGIVMARLLYQCHAGMDCLQKVFIFFQEKASILLKMFNCTVMEECYKNMSSLCMNCPYNLNAHCPTTQAVAQGGWPSQMRLHCCIFYQKEMQHDIFGHMLPFAPASG